MISIVFSSCLCLFLDSLSSGPGILGKVGFSKSSLLLSLPLVCLEGGMPWSSGKASEGSRPSLPLVCLEGATPCSFGQALEGGAAFLSSVSSFLLVGSCSGSSNSCFGRALGG